MNPKALVFLDEIDPNDEEYLPPSQREKLDGEQERHQRIGERRLTLTGCKNK